MPDPETQARERENLIHWLEHRARREELLAEYEIRDRRPSFAKSHQDEAERYRAVRAYLEQQARKEGEDHG